ncbi:protein tyrosine kinase, partial [Methylobacterium radiotolerans]
AAAKSIEAVGAPVLGTVLTKAPFARRDAAVQADVVIIDAPPLLLVTDAAVIARMTTGAILVAASGSTPSGRLSAAAKSIEAVGAPVLGTVLTKAPFARRDAAVQA